MVLGISSIDEMEEKYEIPSNLLDKAKIDVKDRQDRETIGKTQSAAPIPISSAFMTREPEPLTGRVEEKDPSEGNYRERLRKVIASLLRLNTQISETDRKKKLKQEDKYTHSNQEWGVLHQESGDRGFNFSLGSLGMLALGAIAPQGDKEFVNFLANNGLNTLAQMWNSGTDSRKKVVEAVGQLALSEIQAMMNNKSSVDSNKQDLLALLKEIDQELASAARGR